MAREVLQTKAFRLSLADVELLEGTGKGPSSAMHMILDIAHRLKSGELVLMSKSGQKVYIPGLDVPDA